MVAVDIPSGALFSWRACCWGVSSEVRATDVGLPFPEVRLFFRRVDSHLFPSIDQYESLIFQLRDDLYSFNVSGAVFSLRSFLIY